ncbi:MAG TPA: hypothetical protein PKA06_02935 [Gemmatales bacterium]|nr:hypothetical protein [Gemmatales bacterium]
MLRLLMIAGGIFAVAFGLFVVATRFYEGITDRQTQIDSLTLEETNLDLRLARLEKAKKDVDKWKAISLPGNLAASAILYKNYLQEILLRHKLTLKSFSEPNRLISGTTRQAAPVTSNIGYDIVFEARLGQLISFLKDFYSVNVPHAIKNMAIEPLGKGGDLRLLVTMKVEAMAMSNTPMRQSVVPNPTGTVATLEMLAAMKRVPVGLFYSLSQVSQGGHFGQLKLASQHKPERQYEVMTKKNVFAGLASPDAAPSTNTTTVAKTPDPELLKYTQLTSITANYVTEEGLLRIRKTNKYVKLRAEGGVNEFEIRDGDDQLVLKGKVLAIKPRDLVFETGGKAYLLHIGQFMEDALRRELTPEELKQYDVELTAADEDQ